MGWYCFSWLSDNSWIPSLISNWPSSPSFLCSAIFQNTKYTVLWRILNGIFIQYQRTGSVFKYEYAKFEVFWEGHMNLKKSSVNLVIMNSVMSKQRGRFLQILWPSQNIWMSFNLNQSYSILSITQRKVLWGWLNLKNNKSNSWQLLHNSSLMEFHDRLTNLLSFVLQLMHVVFLKNYLIHRVSGASMVMTVNFWWWNLGFTR